MILIGLAEVGLLEEERHAQHALPEIHRALLGGSDDCDVVNALHLCLLHRTLLLVIPLKIVALFQAPERFMPSHPSRGYAASICGASRFISTTHSTTTWSSSERCGAHAENEARSSSLERATPCHRGELMDGTSRLIHRIGLGFRAMMPSSPETINSMNRQLRGSVSDHSRSQKGNDLLREVLGTRIGKDELRNIEEFGRHAGFEERTTRFRQLVLGREPSDSVD